MKRITFIVLWPIVFWIVAMFFGMVGFRLLGQIGTTAFSSSILLAMSMCWAVVFYGMPVLGLILGLRGKLPGTKKIKGETHHDA